MDVSERNSQQSDVDQDEEMGMDQEELRRGPWTVEEDLTLINYIALHGEGRWNSLARSAGLKRTGKSCRLRWLNYLRPDVRRGNITLEEQLLILELHSRWGNRWSKIAQYLPGRTDNEIKNYWRTRVQKHAKQLKCDVNSKQFKDTMRYLWMPRLVERIQASSAVSCPAPGGSMHTMASPGESTITSMTGGGSSHRFDNNNLESIGTGHGQVILNNSSMSTTSSSDSLGAHQQVSPISELTDYPVLVTENPDHNYLYSGRGGGYGGADYKLDQTMVGACEDYYNNYGLLGDFQLMDQDNNYQYFDSGDTSGNPWNVENIWYTNQNI